jgi:hypothetical protein
MKKIVRLTESDLTRIVKRVIKEQSLLMEGVPDTTLTSSEPITIEGRSVCKTGVDYIKGQVKITNSGTKDAYLNYAPTLQVGGGLGQIISTTYEFNVTGSNGKPIWGNPEGQNQPKIPVGATAKLNFVIQTNAGQPYSDYFNAIQQINNSQDPQRTKEKLKLDAKKVYDDRVNALTNLKSSNLKIRYNGQALDIPVNFGGFRIDNNRACDAKILLPKGF